MTKYPLQIKFILWIPKILSNHKRCWLVNILLRCGFTGFSHLDSITAKSIQITLVKAQFERWQDKLSIFLLESYKSGLFTDFNILKLITVYCFDISAVETLRLTMFCLLKELKRITSCQTSQFLLKKMKRNIDAYYCFASCVSRPAQALRRITTWWFVSNRW